MCIRDSNKEGVLAIISTTPLTTSPYFLPSHHDCGIFNCCRNFKTQDRRENKFASVVRDLSRFMIQSSKANLETMKTMKLLTF